MNNIIENADRIAAAAHEGQTRNFGSGDPYITHPRRLAERVKCLPGTDEVDIAAALLHDVIEDVAIPRNEVESYQRLIEEECGKEVLNLVMELTNVTHYPGWEKASRKDKKAADFARLRTVSLRAKRLKMADRLDNLRDMQQAPPRFMKKYIPESRELQEVCRDADPVLAAELAATIDQAAELFGVVEDNP